MSRRATLLLAALAIGPAATARPGAGGPDRAAQPVPARPAPAPVRVVLAPDADRRWVPFTLTAGNQVRFRAMVDGRPAVAILDTGASETLVSTRFAGRAGATAGTETGAGEAGEAVGVGGTLAVGRLPVRSIAFGGLARSNGALAVIDLPAAVTGGGRPADLLVGRDLLEGAALDLDYPNLRFRLLPSGRRPFRGAEAPLTVSPTRRVYESELMLGGRRVRPVLVDTGDGASVTVTRAEWAAAGPPPVPVTSALGQGVGGPLISDVAVVPSLRLGTLDTGEAEVRVEPAGGFSARVGAAGRVGSGLLGRYRVLLDPGAGRMVLRAGPAAAAPVLRSTSGLLLTPETAAGTEPATGAPPGGQAWRLRVTHVMRGGPAAAAGWKDGEVICAVDGQTVGRGFLTGPDAGWTAGTPGRAVRLRGCGPNAAERVLVLRRFY